MLIRKHLEVARTLERAIEREDLAKRDSETLLHRPLADIRDPRRAASPRQMQRSRIPLSSPISVCILRNENERREEHVNVDEHGEHGVRTRTRGGAVGVVVDVGVGDLTEVVPVTRAGLLAPAAQALFCFIYRYKTARRTQQVSPRREPRFR